MSAADLIAEAAAAGVTLVRIGDDRLKWTCAGPPPPGLLERLKANKLDVLRALRSADWFGPDSPLEAAPTSTPAGDAERWRYIFHERAASREYDGAVSRADAEAAALLDCAQQWRCEHPLAPNGPTDPCCHCGKPMTVENCTPVPAMGGHAWMHRECWKPMDTARQQEALDALRALLEAAP